MTGREQQTLAGFVDFATAAFERLEGKVDKIDERVRGLEQDGAKQVGVAAGTAAAATARSIESDRKQLSTVRLLAALGSVATIAGVLVGLIVKFA